MFSSNGNLIEVSEYKKSQSMDYEFLKYSKVFQKYKIQWALSVQSASMWKYLTLGRC